MPCHARPYYTIWYDTIPYYTTLHYTTHQRIILLQWNVSLPSPISWEYPKVIIRDRIPNHIKSPLNDAFPNSRGDKLILRTLQGTNINISHLGKRKIIFKTAGGEMLVSWEGNSFAWTLRRVRTAHSQWFDQGFGWRQLPSLSLPLIKMNSEDRPTRWECRQSGTKGLWNDQLCDFVKQKHQKKTK